MRARKCPDWCGGAHHCTARLGKGSHASTPEVWGTDAVHLVATRHHGQRGAWLEMRMSIRLPEVGDEGRIVALMRVLVATTVRTATGVLGKLHTPRGR